MDVIFNLVLWTYLLGIVPMRFWLPRQTASRANPWLIALIWPVLVGLKQLPKLLNLLQQQGRSVSLRDPASPPLGYVDAPSTRGDAPAPTKAPPPPSDLVL